MVNPSSTAAKVGLLAFLLAVVLGAAQGQQIIDSDFDGVNWPYMELYQDSYDVASENEPAVAFLGHYVLEVPQGPIKTVPPTRMIRRRLLGENGAEATIYLRADNLYWPAFKTRAQQHYHFQGWGALFAHYDPHSVELSFNESYPALAGKGGHVNLVNVPLGRQSFLQAVEVLSNYDPETTSDEDLKLAALKILLMYPESLRLHPIRNAFAPHWDIEGHQDFLTLQQAKYTVGWGMLSYHLLVYHQSRHWPVEGADNMGRKFREMKKKTAVEIVDQALDVVDLVLRNIVNIQQNPDMPF